MHLYHILQLTCMHVYSSGGVHSLIGTCVKKHDNNILIPFWLIIMWDCTAPKMHLTQAMYVICTWDWQQNFTCVICGTFHTEVNTHLPLCSTHNLLIKRQQGLNLCIQLEHVSPCDRSDSSSISGSEAPPTYWLSVKCYYRYNEERQIQAPQALPTYWLSVKVSGMERWREVKSLLHSDQISSVNSERYEKNIIKCFKNETRLSEHTLLGSIHISLISLRSLGRYFWIQVTSAEIIPSHFEGMW